MTESLECVKRPRRNQNGSANPNWKGGISKEFYRYKLIQKQRYPERVKARDLLHAAVQSGKVVRGLCVICQNPKTFGHHQDYSKPLDVIWLCRPCHHGLHNGKLTVQLAGQAVSVTPANLDVWAKGDVKFTVPISHLPTPHPKI